MTTSGTLYVGTSGFAYPDWIPRFYPSGTRTADLLTTYATRLNGVELNNTFYRQPTPKAIETWLAATPEDFRFAVKAQRGAAWRSFRSGAAESVPWLTAAYQPFGTRLRCVLFRVEETTQRDDDALARLLDAWPTDVPLALELRHASWEDDDVHDQLRARGVALVTTDTDELDESAHHPAHRPAAIPPAAANELQHRGPRRLGCPSGTVPGGWGRCVRIPSPRHRRSIRIGCRVAAPARPLGRTPQHLDAWHPICHHPVMGTTKQDGERVSAESAAEWAEWLAAHHTRTTGVWLVTRRARSGQASLGYEDSVIEALRFGWIDSTAGTVDDDRRELWFAPRKRGSGWARTNKRRIELLINEGRMEPAGQRLIDAAKADGSWTLLDDVEDLIVPIDLATAFDSLPRSRTNWDGFPPSARRAILEWIVQAKRPETRARRIEETARLAQEGKRANEWVPRDKRP